MNIKDVRIALDSMVKHQMYYGDGEDHETEIVPKALHPNSLARKVHDLWVKLHEGVPVDGEIVLTDDAKYCAGHADGVHQLMNHINSFKP